ncbi:MAG: sulfite exporter TauE/SafE family protein [Deltaproteobacteria bacterium]|nr:sulfite exporter TauE/SafE family protein [Deltaproteobacteria bacterium]
MNVETLATLAALGGCGGFAAGLLGFGGGVVMFPLLFYVPPALGLARLDAKTVAAIVVSQVFFSTLVGGTAHWRHGRVHRRITLAGGLASAAGSFCGGIISKWVSEWTLLFIFGVVILGVATMMFLPAPSVERELLPPGKVNVPTLPLAAIACVTGVVVGLLGAGNFVFVPLLIYVFQVPTRIAIGSSLFIAMVNTLSGFLGKLLTGQISLLLSLIVISGAALGALAGERTHGFFSPRALRYLYAGMVGIIMVRVWISLLV